MKTRVGKLTKIAMQESLSFNFKPTIAVSRGSIGHFRAAFCPIFKSRPRTRNVRTFMYKKVLENEGADEDSLFLAKIWEQEK